MRFPIWLLFGGIFSDQPVCPNFPSARPLYRDTRPGKSQHSQMYFRAVPEMQTRSHPEKDRCWDRPSLACCRAPDCFPREHWGPVLLLGRVWAILRFTPNCQLSESRHLLGTAQITWGTGLTVPSGLLGSHYSNNCTAPGKLTPSHIKTKKLACLFLWIFILFSA